ncbi:MAG: hypothetical protein ACRDJ9_03320 [Dehalococcoidia bacterium]
MKRFGMAKLGVLAALVTLSAVLLACGGDDTNDTATSGATTGSTAAGKKLSDCDYATTLVRSLETFTNSLPNFGAFQSKEDAINAFNTFDSALGALINEMKSYQLSSDVAKVNNGVVSIFEDARRQIPELKSAVESGNTVRLTEVAARLNQEVFPRLDTIQEENKGAMDKLNTCATT